MENLIAQFEAIPALAVKEADYPVRGYHLEVTVAPEAVVAAAEVMDVAGYTLEAITGIDWLGEEARRREAGVKARNAAAVKAAKEAEEEPPEPETADLSGITEEMEVVYDYTHYDHLFRVMVRCRVARDNPGLPSIHQVFAGADWHEKETHDFFGIVFSGNPDLVPFILPEDADYHPLLKDFST